MTMTETQEISRNRPMFFDSYRPKIWLRRCKDETGRMAIRQYIGNFGKEGEAIALENLRRALGNG